MELRMKEIGLEANQAKKIKLLHKIMEAEGHRVTGKTQAWL